MIIGEYLKAKREDKGVTIEFVAARTKINLNVLKKLEESDIGNLPNKTYVRGFVQSYCKVLDLDFDEALIYFANTYDETPAQASATEVTTETEAPSSDAPVTEPMVEAVGNPTPTEESQLVSNSIEFASSLLHNKKFLFYTGIGTVCLMLSVGAYRVLKKNIINTVTEVSEQKSDETSEVDATIPSPVNAEQAPEKKQVAKVEPKAESKEEKKEEPQKVVYVKDKTEDLFNSEKLKKMRAQKLNEKQKEIEEKAKKAKEEVLAKAETKKEIKENKTIEENKDDLRKFPERKFYKFKKVPLFTILSDAKENEDDQLLPEDIKSKMNDDKQNVFIVAVEGDTWISYKKDDKKIISRLVKQGKSVFLQADLIRLFLGNINVAKIFYNNKLIRTESKNSIKSLIFPESKKVEFEIPLFVPNKDRILFTAEEYKAKMMEETEKFSKEKKI